MAANNGSEEHEAYLEIPLDDYIVLGETAIHKTWSLILSAFMFFSGVAVVAIAAYTNWYSVLAQKLYTTFFVQYWYFTLPLITGGVILTYFFLKGKARKHSMNKQNKQQQQSLTPTPTQKRNVRG